MQVEGDARVDRLALYRERSERKVQGVVGQASWVRRLVRQYQTAFNFGA